MFVAFLDQISFCKNGSDPWKKKLHWLLKTFLQLAGVFFISFHLSWLLSPHPLPFFKTSH